MADLMEMERRGWAALATSREAGVAFYGEALADEAVMLFPGGVRLDGRAAILAAIDAQPWESFELTPGAELALGEGARCVTYRAEAQRAGSPPYAALVSSSYVLRGGEWRLVLHQQTPE